MQLQPGEMMAIVRQLADPNDTGTYYVRATIRNARTDALLDTKDLTDRGGQRFSIEYQVPSKSSDAVYISISTRVYTDSAYTTLSDMYGQEIETYLVEMRQAHFGGGGSNVSYQKIREIVKEEIGKTDKVDLSELVKSLTRLEKVLDGVPGGFEGILGAIEAIQVNPVVNMDPVTIAIRGLMEMVAKERKNEGNAWKEDVSGKIEAVQEIVEGMKKAFEESTKAGGGKHKELIEAITSGSKFMAKQVATEELSKKIEDAVRGVILESVDEEPKEAVEKWQDAMKRIMKT